MVDRHAIEARWEYLAAIEKITAGNGPIGVDAERASGYRYSQRAYLIQVYRRDAGMFLFDPIALGGSLAELGAAIDGEEWILHAASQDLACLREVGMDPTRIFDTELAARLLGLPRVGLGAVVEQFLGIHLKKEHSAADWSTRPLPQAWLEYAALDVELLPDLRDRVAAMLEEQDKTDIAAQEFQAELEKQPNPPKVDPWRKLVPSTSKRNRQTLAVARELWTARDQLARKRDIAQGRLVPDSSLQAAIKANPRTRKALSELRAFTGRASRTEINIWWEAIERGHVATELPPLRMPSTSLPPVRAWADRNPEADDRLTVAKPRLAEYAETRAIPLENLLTPELLRRVAWTPPAQLSTESIAAALSGLGARAWQVEETSAIIAQAFREAPEAASGVRAAQAEAHESQDSQPAARAH